MLELTPLSLKAELTADERARVAPWRLSSDPLTARMARFMLHSNEGDSLERWQRLLSPTEAAVTTLRELVASTCEPMGTLTPVNGRLVERALEAVAAGPPAEESIAILRALQKRFTLRATALLSQEARAEEPAERDLEWAGKAGAILDRWGAPPEPSRNEVEELVYQAATASSPHEAVQELTRRLRDPEWRSRLEQNLPALVRFGREALLNGTANCDALAQSGQCSYYGTLLKEFPQAHTADCLRHGIEPLLRAGVDGWKPTFNGFWNGHPELMGEMLEMGLSHRSLFRLQDDVLELVVGSLRRGLEPTPELRDFLMGHLCFPLSETHTGPGAMAILRALAQMEKARPGILEGAVLPDASGKAAGWKSALLDRVLHEPVRRPMVLNELGGWTEGRPFYDTLFPGSDATLSGPLLEALERTWPEDPSTLEGPDKIRLSILASVPLPPEHEQRLKALLWPEMGQTRMYQPYLQRFSSAYRAEQLASLVDRPLGERVARTRELLQLEIDRDASFMAERYVPGAARSLADTIQGPYRGAALAELYPQATDSLGVQICVELVGRDPSLVSLLHPPPTSPEAVKSFDRGVEEWVKSFPRRGLEQVTGSLETIVGLTSSAFGKNQAYRAWASLLKEGPPWAREVAAMEGTPQEQHQIARRVVGSPRSPEVDLGLYRKLAGVAGAEELLPAFDRLLGAMNAGQSEEEAWKAALSQVVAPGDGRPGSGVEFLPGQVTVGGVRLRSRS